MTDNSTIQSIRKFKTLQLIVFILLELIFFIILIVNKDLRTDIFTNPSILCICLLSWVFFILILASLYYDIYQLRSLSNTSHELQQLAYLDKTGIPNRYSLDLMLDSYRDSKNLQNAGCCLFTIETLTEINENLGREAGDKLIQSFCTILEETGEQYGFVGRNGGNEFIMLVDNCTKALMTLFYSTLDKRLYLYNEENPDVPLHIKRAYTLNSEEAHPSFSSLLTATYTKLS